MKKKSRVLLISYLSVLILTLALYAWAGQWGLGWYRRSANESASLAYEETVRSVQTLAAVLDQGPYATDSDMCDRICCEAYASAAAAESALSVLPFSAWELERLSAWLNTAGDYAHSLCGQGHPFTGQQREELRRLSAAADGFSQTLLELRQDLQDRELRMDSREKRLRNVGTETCPLLSGELLACEADFQPVSLRYDGLYGAEPERSGGLLTEGEMLSAAAAFAGLSPEELEPLGSDQGGEGRLCFQAGDAWLCVDRRGVQSYGSSRLVAEEKLSLREALRAAESFLRGMGLEDLQLLEQSQSACVASFSFAREQGGALCPDCVLRVAIALDDGSLYSFDASSWDPEPLSPDWAVEEESARSALPEELREAPVRRMILRSPGGQPVPCYVFSTRNEEGRTVEISVSAETGRQYRIRVGN
ncbi:MAG: germination protein YpeB [Oscillospiraceae bacterium]|nr:germination protein YpeB [Oscillospiraceae bacterium]